MTRLLHCNVTGSNIAPDTMGVHTLPQTQATLVSFFLDYCAMEVPYLSVDICSSANQELHHFQVASVTSPVQQCQPLKGTTSIALETRSLCAISMKWTASCLQTLFSS